MDEILQSRHRMMDAAATSLVEKHQVRACIEIASGLSARGLRFARRYEQLGLEWVDADLPHMSAIRRQRTSSSGARLSNYRVADVDLLESEGALSPASLLGTSGADGPMAVFMEGLLNYFPRAVAMEALGRLRHALELRNVQGHVVFEIYTRADVQGIRLVRPFLGFLSAFARGPVGLYFQDVDEASQTLRELGFPEVVEVRTPDTPAWPVVRVLVASTTAGLVSRSGSGQFQRV
jgi:hypothetical protein